MLFKLPNMATRQYVVTIETPDDPEENNYTVTVQRHRKVIAEYSNALIPACTHIGRVLQADVESEL
jgi:hypothetical protein